MQIRNASITDAPTIAKIYNHYIVETIVTFEETKVTATEMAARMTEIQADGFPYFVAEVSAGQVVGFAYASKWKGRCSYRYSAEITVYLAPDQGGQGHGTRLYEALFESLESLGYHVAIGGISLPNPASVALHEKFGMQQVGLFKEVGFKFDRWIDVGYWQCVIGSTE